MPGFQTKPLTITIAIGNDFRIFWQRTSLPLEDITDLLSFCLNTTQFVFEGTYYKQVFGTAMGSPVSAVIANLVIGP